jgi:hypothetical protein
VVATTPHCFHSMLNFKTAVHIGTTAVSTLWYNEMETVITTWTLDKNRKFVEGDAALSSVLWKECHQDLALWYEWLADMRRKLMMEKDDKVIKPIPRTYDRVYEDNT